jgi:hypothetical protein
MVVIFDQAAQHRWAVEFQDFGHLNELDDVDPALPSLNPSDGGNR